MNSSSRPLVIFFSSFPQKLNPCGSKPGVLSSHALNKHYFLSEYMVKFKLRKMHCNWHVQTWNKKSSWFPETYATSFICKCFLFLFNFFTYEIINTFNFLNYMATINNVYSLFLKKYVITEIPIFFQKSIHISKHMFYLNIFKEYILNNYFTDIFWFILKLLYVFRAEEMMCIRYNLL